MAETRRRLELRWVGKDERPRPAPHVLVEDPDRSYRASVGDDDIFDNRLIHGDNLPALVALEEELGPRVKCVYIDPPYNTGSAFGQYDDGLEHTRWLSLMRDRLEVLHRLLSDDGSLWISIDDTEVHYLKVLCDEIFGRESFIANMVWERRTSRENRRVFSFNHEHLLVFAKDKARFEQARNPLPLGPEVLARYKNPDDDPRGPWQSISATAQAGHATRSQFYELRAPNGKVHHPPRGRCWLYTKERMAAEIAAGNIWFGKTGNAVPRIKKLLSDARAGGSGLTPETLWKASDAGTNDIAKKRLMQMFEGRPVFDTPKPEPLVARILQIATNPGDWVLDSFLGSGTTAVVAHKLRRRWIGIELGEHASTVCVPRLVKTIDGAGEDEDPAFAGWSGGGGFRAYRAVPADEPMTLDRG